jgi:hypothetical protein
VPRAGLFGTDSQVQIDAGRCADMRRHSETHVHTQAGLDSAVVARFHILGLKVAGVGCLCAVYQVTAVTVTVSVSVTVTVTFCL